MSWNNEESFRPRRGPSSPDGNEAEGSYPVRLLVASLATALTVSALAAGILALAAEIGIGWACVVICCVGILWWLGSTKDDRARSWDILWYLGVLILPLVVLRKLWQWVDDAREPAPGSRRDDGTTSTHHPGLSGGVEPPRRR